MFYLFINGMPLKTDNMFVLIALTVFVLILLITQLIPEERKESNNAFNNFPLQTKTHFSFNLMFTEAFLK
jgi:large-conductance mechanosensitive channel